MQLVYLDESGNTGSNLQDTRQPIFVLAALLVPEAKWLQLEKELQATINDSFPPPRPGGFEVHASELINAGGYFRQFPVKLRLDFFHRWMTIAAEHDLKVIHRAIVKKRFCRWLQGTFGSGVIINPHVAAFPLVAQVVNEYLKSLPDSPLGILVSDENRGVMHDVEKAIRLLRADLGTLRLGQIIEKGFFIESDKSLLLQMCDLCAFAARRFEEQKAGVPVKPVDQNCISWFKPLIHRGTEPLSDVLTWLEAQQKKGAARG